MSKLCEKCPWLSQDPRDVELVNEPVNRRSMERADWFCCHVNLGTCDGARLLHAAHVARTTKHLIKESSLA